MIIHVVHSTMGGYAREDAPVSTVYGAYTDVEVAKKMKLICSAAMTSLEVDFIPPGFQEILDQFYPVS